jgi:hypothetical protein
VSFSDEEVFDWVPATGVVLGPGLHVWGFSGQYADILGVISEVTETEVKIELKYSTMTLTPRSFACSFLIRMPAREDIEQPNEPTRH